MQPGSTTTGPQPGEGEPASGLDVLASGALDRLTRWAAKALRARAAVITLVDDERGVVASATATPESAADSPRLREFACQLVRSGQPYAIGDARSARWRANSDHEGVAFLGTPLLDHSGSAVGSFCVMDIRPRRWTIQDIELVGELAASALTELDLLAVRGEAEREKRWSDRQQAVLELIAARAPLGRTLSELLHAAEAHTSGMRVTIMRLERSRGAIDRLHMIAGLGLPRGFTTAHDGVAVEEGSSISGTAASRREPVVVRDIAAAGLQPWFVELAEGHGLRAGWATPILSRNGAVLGTFTIYYRSPGAPGRDQVVIDRSVHLARLAIEQVDGAEALRRNATRAQSLAREQTALQRVATLVAGEADPKILFGLVAEQVGRLLKAEAGYVLRFEDEDRYRNVGSWAPRDEQRLLAVDAVATHLPDGLCAMLRKSRRARRCTFEPGQDSLGFRHRIAAPVLIDRRSWGMVLAMRDSTEFRREDEKRLARFAKLASVAVANAQAHEALATQARTDPLTALANRRTFDERLAEETERANRHSRPLSVMLVDVDHFKTINDRFGHATGDRVLVSLADNLRAAMRGGDLLARIGGDEMAMILPDCPVEQAALVAQRMLVAISADSSLARRHGVTLSAGVAGLGPGQTADDLLRCADQALYGAKDEGRNQVVSYETDMPSRAGLRLSA